MRELRRAVAVILNLLLLQLVLVGSGETDACGDHGAAVMHQMGETRGHPDGAGVARLPMAGANTSGHGGPSCGAPSESSAGREPCDLPWAPGGCATMASCGVAIITTAPVSAEVALAEAMVAGRASLAPPDPVSPPELPPPRA